MTVNVEFLLTWHPLLFFFGESLIKTCYRVSILATIGSGTGNIHPLSAVKCIRHKLAYKKCSWEIAVNNKTYVFLFATYKAAADIVSRISKINVHIVSHFSCNIKRMFYQNFPELLPLIFRGNAKRAKRKYFFSFTAFVLKPCFCIHYIAYDFAVFFKDKSKFGYKIGVASHFMYIIVLVSPRFINVPKCLAGKFFNCSVIFFCF